MAITERLHVRQEDGTLEEVGYALPNRALPVSIVAGLTIIADIATLTVAEVFRTQTDMFTQTGVGTNLGSLVAPLSSFGLQVSSGGGGAPTYWDARLEGSLDGANFSTVLKHDVSTGINEVMWSGALQSPSLFIRTRVERLDLGPASSIKVTILGR